MTAARTFLVPVLVALLDGCTCSGETTVPPPRPKPRPGVEMAPPARTSGTFALSEGLVPGFPDYRQEGNPVIRLDRTKARVSLPDVDLPPKLAQVSDRFILEHGEMPNPKNAPRKLKVISAPLPFSIEMDEQTFRPEGMSVEFEGKPIPFGRGPAPKADTTTWRVSPNGKQVILSHPTVPPPGSFTVTWSRVREALDRHDPEKFLNDERTVTDFVHTSVTVGGETRNGLLLVAPTTVEWDVTLPSRAPMFAGWIGLEAAPIERPKSDGADIVLTVVEDGRETEVDRRPLTAPGAAEEWRVDLGRFAGKAITLRVSTDPGATPVFDWVFLGSPTLAGSATDDVRRVVVVALDTTRPDHFGFNGYPRPTTPELDEVLGQSVVFDRTWSTAPRTRPSFRSSTTGRLPLEAVGATNIGDVFREHGFVTAGIVANVHLQPRFHFNDGFDWWWFDGSANAKQEVDRGLAWLRANADRDSYLFLHIMDPHMAYDAPGKYRQKFVKEPSLPPKVKRADVLGWMAKGTLTPEQKEELEGLHDGEMAFTSHELGRFFSEVDQLPGRTLVVLHSDHGEEFWEHGGFEHNHSLYDELVRTMLAFRPGGGLTEGQRPTGPTSLMDIAPTLYDLFGFADAPPVDGRSLMPVLAGEPPPDRALPVGYLQYSHERWAVVWQGKKYILHTGTGQEELYDLGADPDEKVDLASATDLVPFRARLAEVHGIPVGPGFRVAVDAGPQPKPLTFVLPAPALQADILDPEAMVEHRANVEWGELPKKYPAEVGKVTLSSDKKTLTFSPGRRPQGTLYVLFDTPQDPAAVTVTQDGSPVAFQSGTGPRTRCGKLCIDAGTVVVPPLSEASRMGIGGKEDDMSQLCLLGYVTEGCDASDVAPPAEGDPGDRSDDDRGDPEHGDEG